MGGKWLTRINHAGSKDRLYRPADVGMGEVGSLEQERLRLVLGQGVGEAIAEIELRGMTTAPIEVSIGLAGNERLAFIHDAGLGQKLIEAADEHRIAAAIGDDGGL
jgi:hypothetical protein